MITSLAGAGAGAPLAATVAGIVGVIRPTVSSNGGVSFLASDCRIGTGADAVGASGGGGIVPSPSDPALLVTGADFGEPAIVFLLSRLLSVLTGCDNFPLLFLTSFAACP